MNNPTENIPENLIQEIGNEITKLRKENEELKTIHSLNKTNLKIKLDKYCITKCVMLCKLKEKETKENCIIKDFIDDIGN